MYLKNHFNSETLNKCEQVWIEIQRHWTKIVELKFVASYKWHTSTRQIWVDDLEASHWVRAKGELI